MSDIVLSVQPAPKPHEVMLDVVRNAANAALNEKMPHVAEQFDRIADVLRVVAHEHKKSPKLLSVESQKILNRTGIDINWPVSVDELVNPHTQMRQGIAIANALQQIVWAIMPQRDAMQLSDNLHLALDEINDRFGTMHLHVEEAVFADNLAPELKAVVGKVLPNSTTDSDGNSENFHTPAGKAVGPANVAQAVLSIIIQNAETAAIKQDLPEVAKKFEQAETAISQWLPGYRAKSPALDSFLTSTIQQQNLDITTAPVIGDVSHPFTQIRQALVAVSLLNDATLTFLNQREAIKAYEFLVPSSKIADLGRLAVQEEIYNHVEKQRAAKDELVEVLGDDGNKLAKAPELVI